MKLIDLTGKKFNRLTVLNRNGSLYKKAAWLCMCDCGNTVTLAGDTIKSGHTKSCGCLQSENYENLREKRITHGKSKTTEYKSWASMRERCLNPNSKFYSFYGGRGISICDRWDNFQNFLDDMGLKPSPHHSLDRINVDGNYEPSNCRWATDEQQVNNTSRNVYITIDGVTKTMSQWCHITGVDPDLASQRILRDKWSPSDAVSIPTKSKRLK